MHLQQHGLSLEYLPGTKYASLPTEILCEIFALASSISLAEFPKQRFMPIVISHVDRRWREIVLDLPNLWTPVRISGYDATVLDTVFTRSKGHSLDIFLDYPQATPTGANLRLWNTLISVLSQMYRCRSLTISTVDANFKLIRNVFGYRCMAPLLESLKLTCIDAAAREPSIFPVINYDITKLSSIYVDGLVLMNTLSMGVKEMEIRNTVGPWDWPRSSGSLDSTFHSLTLERLTLVNVPVPQSTTFETPALTEIICRGRNSETIFNSDFNPTALSSIEVSQVDTQTWAEIVNHFSRTWQLQRFNSVKHLTLSDFDTSALCADRLDVRFPNAFSGLSHCNFVNASPKFLFNILSENSTVWPNVSFDIDGIKVPHPATGIAI
ncbi:hypothetical protein BDZ94DRAFT_420844 [Collybia nuda]|uniref:F-box domain-containing protein n=1 Tax=Collybia nuda TaxID=64659 RepID=A0A9P5XT48_9AGAR|nr:hypothetical protein BDZ94DRAFT_420844 [Collybia nuda]